MTRLRFLVLLPLVLLAGCLDFDLGSSVSWSPDGRRVAFLADGRPWVYALEDGKLESLPIAGRYDSLAWSPAEPGWIALSTATMVRLYCSGCGVRGGPSLWDFPLEEAGTPTSIMWHPDGDRLLVQDFSGEHPSTWRVTLADGKVERAGAGLGFWGPGGHWILWGTSAPIGRREDHMLFERQDEGGRVLTLPRELSGIFDAGVAEFVSAAADRSALPLCPQRQDERRRRTEVYCLEPDGSLSRAATLPGLGRVFPDVSRSLFAVLLEPQNQAPVLAIYDEHGRKRADGAALVEAVAEDGRFEERRDPVRASRLAWSPDGNWIAWVVDGRLALWNWRNDVVRLHSPPR